MAIWSNEAVTHFIPVSNEISLEYIEFGGPVAHPC